MAKFVHFILQKSPLLSHPLLITPTIHSYRYAWAERAKQCGYPERFAQQALGHNSAAVHRAYAKKAQVKLPSLEEYEKKIIQLPAAKAV